MYNAHTQTQTYKCPFTVVEINICIFRDSSEPISSSSGRHIPNRPEIIFFRTNGDDSSIPIAQNPNVTDHVLLPNPYHIGGFFNRIVLGDPNRVVVREY